MIANRHGRTNLLSLSSPRCFSSPVLCGVPHDHEETWPRPSLSSRKEKNRSSSGSSSRVPRDFSRRVFLRNVAVSSRIDEFLEFPQRILASSLYYSIPRKRCITGRARFFPFIPRTHGRCRNRRLRESVPNALLSRAISSRESPSSIICMFSLVPSLSPWKARRSENRRGTAFKTAGRASRETWSARSFERGSGSNESMKNNTCPGPAAKIVNAARS